MGKFTKFLLTLRFFILGDLWSRLDELIKQNQIRIRQNEEIKSLLAASNASSNQVVQIERKLLTDMALDFTVLTQAVNDTKGVELSAVTLIGQIAQEIAANAGDQQKISDFADQLNQVSQTLAAAVAANATPVAPVAPVPPAPVS